MNLSEFLPTGNTRLEKGKEPVNTVIPPQRTLSGEFNRMVESIKKLLSGGESPTPSPTPALSTPQPQQATPPPFEFNFKPHIGPETKREIYAPPQEDLPLYQEYFPQEATSAATVAFNESMYNPEAINENTKGKLKGTSDRGYFQMNDVSVQDLLKYYPNTMKKIGVNNFKDWTDSKWKDKEINFKVAKLYRDKFEDRPGYKPWMKWLGWQDWGFKDVGKKDIDYSK